MPVSARRFALRLLVFFAPLLILIGVVEAALWQSGETVPITKVVAWQTERWRQDRTTLWHRGVFGDNSDLYKKEMFRQRQPQIVALGSSRVLKFRAEMLGADGKDFLNCGRMITRIEHLVSFVNSLQPETTPRVVFLGVDHWWLNPNRAIDENSEIDATFDWRAHLTVWRKLLKNPKRKNSLSAKLNLAVNAPRFDPLGRETLGIRARLNGGGFRGDGSRINELPQPATPAQWKIDTEEWLGRVARGTPMNRFATGVSPAKLLQLRAALKKLKSKNVMILVFAPPQLSGAVTLQETMPQHRGLWREYMAALPALCRELDIVYCDASSPQKLGLNDAAMTDGIHAEETLHLYILREWLKDARVRKALPDASRVVEAAIKSPRTGLWFPDLSAANAARSTPAAPGNRPIQPGGQSSARPPKT